MVDVTEMKDADVMPENILEALFEKQQTLVDKYIDIEEMGDLMDKTSTNLDTLEGQIWLKDFIYRAIEEVGESFEVIRDELIKQSSEHGVVSENIWRKINDKLKIHYSEEIIDALHFFIELCIIVGYKASDFDDISKYGINHNTLGYNDFEQRHWRFVESMTLAGNCLRNKKWKKSHVLTDRNKFKRYIDEALNNLLTIVKSVGLNDSDIYNLYFKKHQVNQFRQRSKY